jgi:hypothetical protein
MDAANYVVILVLVALGLYFILSPSDATDQPEGDAAWERLDEDNDE